MFRDLTEENLVIVSNALVELLARRSGPDEVDTLAVELDFLPVCDEELFGTVVWLNVSGLCEFVWDLVVNKDPISSNAAKEIVEQWAE